jgi:hypothetical protein
MCDPIIGGIEMKKRMTPSVRSRVPVEESDETKWIFQGLENRMHCGADDGWRCIGDGRPK